MSQTTLQAPEFREIQRLRQWWIFLLLGGLIAIMWSIWVVQIIFGEPVGTHPAPDGVVWVLWLAVGVGLPLFLWSCRLVTIVRDDAVVIAWVPLYRRRIRLADILQCEAVTYQPFWQYGGWGLRWNPKLGWAYSMSGNRGVQLELRNGKRVLIGSHQAEALAAAIESRRRELSSGA